VAGGVCAGEPGGTGLSGGVIKLITSMGAAVLPLQRPPRCWCAMPPCPSGSPVVVIDEQTAWNGVTAHRSP